MRRVRSVFAFLFVLTLAPLMALAADLEKPAALDGTAYAVIAPVFNNPTGSQSFIRLFNGGASSANFVVTVIGSPSARTYGTATIAIPANASIQYGISLLLSLTSSAALNGGDDAYAVYLTSTEPKAGYQHAIYNNPTQFFQNASVCTALVNQVLGATSGRILNNVHTSVLSGFPSNIYIHNYRNAAVTYRVTVIDAGYADSTTGAIRAGSGAIIGSQDVTVGANTTYTKPFTFFQTALGWTPSATQYHANVVVTNPSSGTSYDLVSQTIANQSSGGELDMSTACAINPPAFAAATATTTYAGTIAGKNGQSGKLSVTVQSTLASASAPVEVAQSAVEKPQAVSQASGTLITGGATISLTGTYDSATAAIALSGSGYTFTGSVSGGAYSGSYTGPNSAAGGFSALNATTAPVSRYCGTWDDGEDTGTFNVQISASGALTGVTYGGGGVTLSGQKSGSAISGQSSEGVTFSGTVSTSGTVSGTFVPTGGGSGSFTGASCS